MFNDRLPKEKVQIDYQNSAPKKSDMKPAEQPKKHFPSFWKTLKHPSSPSYIPPELSTDPLKNLTHQQRETYYYLVNTLSSPSYELPISSSNNNDFNKPQSPLVSPKLTELEKCYCSRECLLRVCRATGWDSNRALKRLVDTLVWRRDFQVDQIDYRELWDAVEPGVEFTIGYDNRQRPLLYMFPSKQTSQPTSNQIKLLVWYLERTIDLMPPGVESLTLMIDFGSSETSSRSPPAPISTAKEVLKILQTYYCERLGLAICINVPWIFWGFFKILKPFLDPKTRQKVLFDPVVIDHVPAEQLLKEGFQGDLDFQYDRETYLPLLAELTANRRHRMLARYRRLAKGMVGMSEFELRGVAPQSNTRREISIGSATTATSTQVTHSASTSREIKNYTPSPDSNAFRSQSSSKPESSLNPQINASTQNTERFEIRNHKDQHKIILLGVQDPPIVASRPFSLNSFSSPFVLPSSHRHKIKQNKPSKEIKKNLRSSLLFQAHEKTIGSDQTHTHPHAPLSSTTIFPISPTIKKSNKNRLSFPFQKNHNQHEHFDFLNLVDLSRDEQGRVRTDSMSYSRRINEVFV